MTCGHIVTCNCMIFDIEFGYVVAALIPALLCSSVLSLSFEKRVVEVFVM